MLLLCEMRRVQRSSLPEFLIWAPEEASDPCARREWRKANDHFPNMGCMALGGLE